MKSPLRTVFTSSFALGLSLAAAPALAQNTDGAFQIGLSAPVLRYQSESFEIETPIGDEELDRSATNIGIDKNVILELGYGLTDILILGGYVQIAHEKRTTESEGDEDVESTETKILIGPKFEAMFMPGNNVRPFVGGMVGLASASEDTDFLNANSSIFGVALEARGGIRWFPTPGFSIDPALAVGWMAGSGETEVEVGPTRTDLDLSGSIFHVGLNVGFSGWIL